MKEIYNIKEELTDENGFLLSPFDSEFNNISKFVGKNREQCQTTDVINEESNDDDYDENIAEENDDDINYNDEQYHVDLNNLDNELPEHV
jgi:hypothetical protein